MEDIANPRSCQSDTFPMIIRIAELGIISWAPLRSKLGLARRCTSTRARHHDISSITWCKPNAVHSARRLVEVDAVFCKQLHLASRGLRFVYASMFNSIRLSLKSE